MFDRELWGALSVSDHLRPRPLVAEVLLFDRIVVPTPPPGDDEEMARWREKGWDPKRQADLLSILGDAGRPDDLAVPAPWTRLRRETFDALYESYQGPSATRTEQRAKLISGLRHDAQQLRPDAQMMTRMILTRGYDEREPEYERSLPRAWVEAVVPAYASYHAADRELGLGVHPPEAAQSLVHVFGWEVFVPEDADWSDERALEETAKLARSDDYRSEREALRAWWRENVGAGMPPEVAVRDLAARSDRLNAVALRAQRRTRTLRAFGLFGAATSAATIWFPPAAIPGAVVALAAVGAEALMKADAPAAALAPAAMIHDARKHFGWY